MPLKARHFLLLSLVAACTPERPAGAYTPVYSDGGRTCKKGFSCGTADAGDQPVEDEDASDGEIGEPEPDASDEPESDSGEPNPNYLAKLKGNYLMRVDYYSTVDEMQGVVRLALKNRVSNFFLTTLTPGEGKLEASEQPCFQTSAHACIEDTCREWTTVYAGGVATEMQKMAPITRDYAVDQAGNLIAPVAYVPLGYSDDGASLPTGTSDMRAWQLDMSEEAKLRGVATSVYGWIGPINVDCEIDSVQKFATAFTAKLATLDAAGLEERIIEVDSERTSVPVVIAAIGEPPQFCDKTELNKPGRGSEEQIFVRFKKTTATACPASASAFENTFKLKAAENLDPPTPTDRLP
jgi:hypothetical protein